MSVKLKICGMKHLDNIQDVIAYNPDYLGFIFYAGSKRYMESSLDAEALKSLPKEINKVGVFVNHSYDDIVKAATKYNLNHVQLHGEESPDLCKKLKKIKLKVIKVFAVGNDFDLRDLHPFKTCVDYYLFDTKGDHYGGHGRSFDWSVIKGYDNVIPVFLSGGIGPDNIDKVKELDWLNIHAVDINSCVESEPGLKDLKKIKMVKEQLSRHRPK